MTFSDECYSAEILWPRINADAARDPSLRHRVSEHPAIRCKQMRGLAAHPILIGLVLVAGQQIRLCSILCRNVIRAKHAGICFLIFLGEGRLLVNLLVLKIRRQLILVVVDGLADGIGGTSACA